MIVVFLILILSTGEAAQDDPLRLAARMDSEQKCAEAEQIYQQVLAQRAPSAALWNNLGNHYLVCGDAEKARSYFERVVKSNPQHANANLQLARIAVDAHQGARSLEYLSRTADTQPAVRMLHAEALHWAGKHDAALAVLDTVQPTIGDDERLMFLYGVTCARIGAYARAETALQTVLARRPDDFDVLFALGRAASRAGHPDRARGTLELRCDCARKTSNYWWNSGRSMLSFRTTSGRSFCLRMPGNWPRTMPKLFWPLRVPPRAESTMGTRP